VKRFLTFMVRRTLAGLFTIWAIVTISFFVFWAIPQEPAQFVYPTAQHLTNYMVKHGNHLLGTDRPILTQYGDYLWQLLQGDFGKQWNGAGLIENKALAQISIGPQLQQWLPVTLSIVLGGAVLVVLLSVPLGAIAGKRIGALSDRTISLVALLGICTHPMVIGLILRGIFGEHFHWAPIGGYCPLTGAPSQGGGPPTGPVDPFTAPGSGFSGSCGGVADWTSHLVLPWLTFALLFLALYTRMIRASVAETLPEDYVRTARAKGARELRVMTRHVLPNASIRVLTMVGMEVGTAIGVCAYIETAYNMNGLGREAIFTMIGQGGLDLPLILGIVTVITLIVVLGNLLVDALYAVVDPRVRFGAQETRTKSLAGGVI